MKTLIQELVAAHAWSRTVTDKYRDECSDRILRLEKMLPSGGGIDSGTQVIECTPTKVVLECSYHHMNDAGMYDGWTKHRVTVRPAFQGIYLSVSGKDRNQIKEYLSDTFYNVLQSEVVA